MQTWCCYKELQLRGEGICSILRRPWVTMLSWKVFAALLLASTTTARWLGETRTEDGVNYQCKCYDDHACWPSAKEWAGFNKTLGGALQLAIPAAASCHTKFENYTFPTYDAEKCAYVTTRIGNGILSGDQQWLCVPHPPSSHTDPSWEVSG